MEKMTEEETLEEERLHLAVYDVEITREIYLIVAKSPYLKKIEKTEVEFKKKQKVK